MKIFAVALPFFFLIIAPAWSQTSKPSSPADLASYTGSDRERLLVEGAKREGKVVWYTTWPLIRINKSPMLSRRGIQG